MFCLANSCRYKSGHSLWTLIGRGIQPRTLGPIFNSVISYADECNPTPNPCGGRKSPSPSARKRCSPDKRRDPCGPTKGGGHDLCYKPYVVQPITQHDYKNMALRRPMSPHLEVYGMTLPAGMSILQRITGVVVTAYALLLSGGTLFLANGIETYVSIIQSLDMSNLTVCLVKVALGLSFTFHYFNGIRFCLWNTARFLDLKMVYSTANIVIFLTVITAGAFSYFL